MTELLHPLLARATASVPEALGAGIDLCDQNGGRTIAAAGCAIKLDDLQWKVGEGPAPSAAGAYEVVVSADLRDDERWPRLREELAGRALVDTATVAAVARPGPWHAYGFTVFTFYLARFPSDEVLNEIAQFEAPAAIALAVIEAKSAEQVDQMRALVRTRGVIDQAKGIIMGRVRCTPDEAFDVLRLASQQHNVKVRDVAAALVRHTTSGVPTAVPESPTDKVARLVWEGLSG